MLEKNVLLNRIVLAKDEMMEITNRQEASVKPGAPAMDSDFWTRVWDTTEQSLKTSAMHAKAFRYVSRLSPLACEPVRITSHPPLAARLAHACCASRERARTHLRDCASLRAAQIERRLSLFRPTRPDAALGHHGKEAPRRYDAAGHTADV